MEEKQVRTRSVKTTPRQDIMIDELAAKHGLSTFSALFGMALSNFHAKTFPDYIAGSGRNKPDPALNPETIARKKVAIKNADESAQKEDLLARKRNIIEQLEAEVRDIDGTPFAIYYTHTISSDTRQILPLVQISEALVVNQWSPSRKAVERLRKEKKRKIVKNDKDAQPE